MKKPERKAPTQRKSNPDNQITVALTIFLISLVGVIVVSLFLYLWFTGTTLF